MEKFLGSRVLRALVVGVCVFVGSTARADSRGTDFWVAFIANFDNGASAPQTLTLNISAEAAASGTVAVPGIGFSQSFNVAAGGLTQVIIPNGAVAGADAGTDGGAGPMTQPLGIHVTANTEVTVQGLHDEALLTDGFLGLPVDSLGTQYRVMAYFDTVFSEIGVVASTDGTVVTVLPNVSLDGGLQLGAPLVRTLNTGDVLFVPSSPRSDLTGSTVTSTQPVAVFGGVRCAFVPPEDFACNHLVEQMTPTSAWGSDFITVPLASRVGGDRVRVLANTDNTTVTINGTNVATLNAGQFYEQVVTVVSHITSSQPVLVAYFSQGMQLDLGTGDPTMMLIPPTTQFLTAYSFNSPTSMNPNFVNVVAPTASLSSLTLDGTAVNTASFTAVSGTSFSTAQLSLTQGTHRLVGSSGFGAYVYGFGEANAYGFPAGMGVPTQPGGDGGIPDAGTTDAGTPDAGTPDAGTPDAGTPDAGIPDAGTPDAGTPDAGIPDAGTPDAGTPDAGIPDAGKPDAGAPDAGAPDAGAPDAGAENPPPEVCPGDDAFGVEGCPVQLNGTAIDTDPLIITWSATPGLGVDPGASCVFANPAALSTTVTCDDDGLWIITLTASDGVNPPVSASLALTISNANPTVEITSPHEGAVVSGDSTVSVTAIVQDPGSNDSLTCTIDWGDGTSSAGVLSNGLCTGQHAYSALGTFRVVVRAADDDGGSGSDCVSIQVQEAVVGHTIIGSGTIEPRPYRNHDRKDRVGFRFYASTFSGQLRGGLAADSGANSFRSVTLTSLTVDGTEATWSGTGRWNGQAGYTFTAVIDDDRTPGRRGRDRFSITITGPDGLAVLDAAGILKSGFIYIR